MAAADPLDRRNAQLHRSHLGLDRLRAERDGPAEGGGGVLHAKRHRAGRGPVHARKLLAESRGLGIDDEIDVALAVQRHVLAAVARADGKSHAREQRSQELRVRRRVFHELEAVGAHRIVELVGHGPLRI